MTRVRFAPSPTGALHIGGIRTALYNYLLARKRGGTFILRVEDTDQTRYVPGAEDYILRSLDWLGLTPDEGPVQGGPHGPYRQSERTAIYKDHADRLVRAGKAYIAFDTPEELEAMRARLAESGVATPKYDASVRMTMRNSLSLPEAETERLVNAGVPYTVRLKVEPDDTILIRDLVRGDVTFDTTELDDKVLLKADGYPTYHLANVVDDRLMEITDVIRGEEWLPSTAHHVLLYRAFGWEHEMPSFSHLPLILKPDGQGKLSKRDGRKFGFPVFPLAWPSADPEAAIDGFDSFGFEPAAVINFLAFLGWNPGTEQELFTITELIKAFDPERIHKAGARFDYEKALWFNQQYVHRLTYAEAEPRLRQMLADAGLDGDRANLEAVFTLLQPRLQRLSDLVPQSRYFFEDALAYDEAEIRKKWSAETGSFLLGFAEHLSATPTFDAAANGAALKDALSAANLKMGQVMPVLRAALTGAVQGPDVFGIADVLGRDRSVNRIRQLVERFNHSA
jgi:glutamyl-tRNA synthetase